MKDIVVSEKELHEICKRLGHELTERYKDNVLPPVFIGVMKGALPFMMDLIREVECPILTDYVTISSYMGKESTGVIKLKKDIDTDLTGRDVVIVEDIIDTGVTLEWFKEYLKNKESKEKRKMKKGKLFVIDGTDGSGKQTQLETLKEKLMFQLIM